MTLKTEVEAGASGYSVTGGGDQGIFVKQVLKDSSAAKLFSLREGARVAPSRVPWVPLRVGGHRGARVLPGAQMAARQAGCPPGTRGLGPAQGSVGAPPQAHALQAPLGGQGAPGS